MTVFTLVSCGLAIVVPPAVPPVDVPRPLVPPEVEASGPAVPVPRPAPPVGVATLDAVPFEGRPVGATWANSFVR